MHNYIYKNMPQIQAKYDYNNLYKHTLNHALNKFSVSLELRSTP